MWVAACCSESVSRHTREGGAGPGLLNPTVALSCCCCPVSLSLRTCHSESCCTVLLPPRTCHFESSLRLESVSEFRPRLSWLVFPRMSSLRIRTMKRAMTGTKSCVSVFTSILDLCFKTSFWKMSWDGWHCRAISHSTLHAVELSRGLWYGRHRPVPIDPRDGQSLPKTQKPPILSPGNFIWREECHSHMFLVIPSLPVCFKTSVSYFACNPAEVEVLSMTLGIEDGKEPAVCS